MGTQIESHKVQVVRHDPQARTRPDALYFHGAELERVPKMRDLGVILDTKATFATQVSHIVSRANRSLGLMIQSSQAAS